MQVVTNHSQRGNKPSAVFRACTNVTFVLAFGLSVVAVWSVWRFTQHDTNDWASDHTDLPPAYTYFDTNRDAGAILAIRKVQFNVDPMETGVINGLSGTSTVTDGLGTNWATDWQMDGTLPLTKDGLGTWRGSVAGCIADDVVSVGTCSSNSISTGIDIPANAAVGLNRWRSKKDGMDGAFAVLRTQGARFQEKDADSCDLLVSKPDGFTLDCGNHCFKIPKGWLGGCPYSQWNMSKTAASFPASAMWTAVGDTWVNGWTAANADTEYKLYYQRIAKNHDKSNVNPESVGLAVEWYGTSCVNPTLHAVDPRQQYVLINGPTTGCGSLGVDPLSDVADSQHEWDFYQDNGNQNGKAAVDLTQYQSTLVAEQDFKVHLMNRRRILVKNTKFCDEFRYNDQKHASFILECFDSIWNMVKWLAIISSSTAIVASMMVLLVLLEGYRKQSQTFMFVLYSICLAGLFCSVVLIWKTKYLIDNDYVKPHEHFLRAQSDECITNSVWSGLLDTWITHTSFGDLGTQLVYTLVCFVIVLLLGVVFAIWALMKLARNQEVGRQLV